MSYRDDLRTASVLTQILLPRRDDHTRNVTSDVVELMWLARALRRSYERACNEPCSDRYLARTDRMEARVGAIAATFTDLRVEHQRDPRGASITLHYAFSSSGHLSYPV